MSSNPLWDANRPQQPVHGCFRDKLGLLVGERDGQLPGTEFRVLERRLIT